jgi:hypothetical protein
MDTICGPSAYSTPVRRFTKIDRRRRSWRRRSELICLYTEQLVEVTGTKALEVERLADLTVLAETQRAAMLAGEPVDVFGLARLENTVSRLASALGLTRRRRMTLTPNDPLEYAKRYCQEESAGA